MPDPVEIVARQLHETYGHGQWDPTRHDKNWPMHPFLIDAKELLEVLDDAGLIMVSEDDLIAIADGGREFLDDMAVCGSFETGRVRAAVEAIEKTLEER